MKTWKIHLGWAFVTILCSATWGQRSVRTREIEFLEREKVLQVRIVDAKKAAVVAAPAAAAPAPAPPAALPVAIPDLPAREYEVKFDNLPTVEELRRKIRNDQDVWTAYQVVLRMVKSPIKTQLARELLESKEPQVRRSAMYLLLESLGPDGVAPLLQQCLRTDPAPEVREAAAKQLGNHDAPGNLEALMQAFQKDELLVQVACASALVEHDQPGPAAQLVPRFAALLDSPDGALRRQAVESLRQLRCPQAMPYLTRALRDTNGDVRLEAVNSLWSTNDPAILGLVEPLLNDPVQDVRDTARSLLDDATRAKE
jgi:HEAT repeat protein